MKFYNVRPLGIAEPRSFDFDVWIAFLGEVPDLRADVFAFSIAIGPYEEYTVVSCLALDVFSNGLLVLWRMSVEGYDYKKRTRRTASTDATIGASKRSLGSQSFHPLYLPVKSCLMI